MPQMIRSIALAFTAVLLAAGTAAAQQAAPLRVAYVNTQAVLAQTPARATAETEFNRQFAPYRAEVARMDSTLQAMIAGFDQNAPQPQRDTRAREIQERQTQYQQRMEAIEDTAAAVRQRLLQPIFTQLERALEEVRREGGFALIFDVGQGQTIVAADTTLDVTPRVITKMGGSAQGVGATRPPAGPVAAPAGVTSRPTPPPDR